MLDGYELPILMTASVVSVAISTRFVFRVASSVTLLKMLALRSIIKVVVGLLSGILLSVVFTAVHKPSLTLAVILFALTCVLASVAGLCVYKWLLAKILNLHFSFRQFLVGYFTEVAITALFSATAIVILLLSVR
ncbi:hypothetical protein [Vibrio fluvialis]|uniref:hypothetical protein n=1 Tax=Vibrio fluvialis TaxID=676 RepID=UPI00257489B5|nr:hypothetical protein [Vibrio fluvialis]BEI26540.1 hypothetical protein KKIDH5335_48720 [Vibrio fluvialis]